MSDLARIDRNMKRLFEQKAPDEHIAAYLQGEGVSAQQVAEWKQSQKPERTWGGFVHDTFVGSEDPAYKGLPTAKEAGLITDGSRGWSLLAGTDDKGLADIVQKDLGDRFVRHEADSKGFPVIVYRDAQGQEAKAYANRPTWDLEDVERGFVGSLPFMASGGLTGAVVKGTGLATRAAAQGLAGAATSGAQDLTSQTVGSKQPVSAVKAGFAGLGGAGGEALGAFVSSLMRNRAARSALLSPDGKLNDKGKAAALDLGLNPDDVTDEIAREVNANIARGVDPVEAVLGTQTNKFDIRTTRGQRTNDPQALLIERDMRYGTLGEEAKRQMKRFDDEQKASLRAATESMVGKPQRVGRDGAENYPGLGTTMQDSGELVQSAWQTARGKAAVIEREAWEQVTDIRPTSEGLGRLPQAIQSELKFDVVPELHPAATQMAKRLSSYMQNKAIAPSVPDVLGPGRIQTIDQMRRQLLEMSKSAADPSDRAVSSAIYGGYLKWIDDIAEQSMVRGDPQSAIALTKARAVTKEVRSAFAASNGQGARGAAGKILEKMAAADTPENAILALFGASGPTAAPKEGSVTALKAYRAALEKFGGDHANGGQLAAYAWSDLKTSYWARTVTDKAGELLTPRMIRKNIFSSLRNRSGLMRTLYTPEELRTMRQFASALKALSPDDPNPSKTGAATRGFLATLTGDVAKMQQARSRFKAIGGSTQGAIMTRVWGLIAKRMPDFIERGLGAGGAVARRATSQELTRSRPWRPTGAASGAIAGDAYGRRNNRE